MNRGKTGYRRIIIFTVEAPPSFAGAGLNAYNFAKYLSKDSASVIFCHLNYNGKLPRKTVDENLKIHRFSYYNYNILTKSFSFLPLLIKYLRFIFKGNIILVYSSYLIGYQFIIIMASLLGRKVIFRSTLLEGDDAISLTSKGFILSKLNKYALMRLSMYFSINAEFTQRFLKITNNKIPVYESFQGVDTNRFYPVSKEDKIKTRRQLGLESDEIIILSVGNLLRRKGYHLIFPQLAKLKMNFKYLVIGEYSPNQYHRVLKSEIKEMNELYCLGKDILGSKVVFTGPVNNVQEYFQACDFFLNSSMNEGTPNALLEAMASGIPSIIRPLHGISGTLIKHEFNALEYHNFDEVSKIINHNIIKPEKMNQIGEQARKTILEKYNFEKVARNFLQRLYD